MFFSGIQHTGNVLFFKDTKTFGGYTIFRDTNKRYTKKTGYKKIRDAFFDPDEGGFFVEGYDH